jgi:AcrR family transcriptional regulator
MTQRARGRPSGRADRVSATNILAEALDILDCEGLDALTMRALAIRAGVSPMTIHYHFGDRDGLIKALAEFVYTDIDVPSDRNARAQIESLLGAYWAKVVSHPSLTLAIFNRPQVFPDHARRITECLRGLLEDLGLSSTRSLLWLHILVDYTHGAALATAMSAESSSAPDAAAEQAGTTFSQAVSELLDRIAVRERYEH